MPRPVKNSASVNCQVLAFEANTASFILFTLLLQFLNSSFKNMLLIILLFLNSPMSEPLSPYLIEVILSGTTSLKLTQFPIISNNATTGHKLKDIEMK